MRTWSPDIAAKWAAAAIEQERRWPWDLAVGRAKVLYEIDEMMKRARLEMADIRRLRA